MSYIIKSIVYKNNSVTSSFVEGENGLIKFNSESEAQKVADRLNKLLNPNNQPVYYSYIVVEI